MERALIAADLMDVFEHRCRRQKDVDRLSAKQDSGPFKLKQNRRLTLHSIASDAISDQMDANGL